MHVRFVISGRVQGVGYRAWVVEQAGKLGLTGWVKNLPDGRVECVAKGDKKALKQLISFCRKGPPAARVNGVDVHWIKSTGESGGFEVIY